MKKFFDFLDTLRSYPRPTRRKISLLSAAGITLLVAIIWIFFVHDRFSTLPSLVEETPDQFQEIVSPFGAIKKSFGDLIDTFKHVPFFGGGAATTSGAVSN